MNGQATPEVRYWAFISYSSLDAQFAKWLHRSIETYGIPAQFLNHQTPVGVPAPKRFRPIFHDRSELPASSDLGAQIVDALTSSQYLIVVCSPHAARSLWVNREIETFTNLGRPDRILPVILEGKPNVGGEEECFPKALRSTEPIAADARPDADGRNSAKLKIVAGMLGVRFDALKDRDAQLRVQRLRWAVLAASTLVVVFAALAGLAWWQRRIAIEQRELAFERTNDLRDVLSRLIWNLYSDVEGIPGSLNMKKDLLDGSGSRLQELSDKYPTDDGLSREVATTYSKLGTVQFQMGQPAAARTSLRHAIAINQTLVGHDARNGFYQLDLASNLRELGAVDLVQGELDSARSHLKEGLGILQQLPETRPIHELVTREMALSHLFYAEVAWGAGKQDEAASEFTASKGIFDALASANPTVSADSSDLADALFREAEFYRLNGRLALAESDCVRGGNIIRAIYNSMTPTIDAAKITAFGVIQMSETLLAQGQINEATDDINTALSIITGVRTSDPQDFDAVKIYIQGQLLKGRILMNSNQLNDAKTLFLQTLEECKQVVGIDSSNLEARALEAIAEGELAIATQGSGAGSDARQYSRDCHRLANATQSSGLIPFPALRQLLDQMAQRKLD